LDDDELRADLTEAVEELNLWFPLPVITGTLTGPRDISSEGMIIRLPVNDEPR
jgi:hypothetical protein